MSPFPDYSAAYLVLRTAGGEQGFGLVFTVGRGNDLQAAAIKAFEPLVTGLDVDEAIADLRAFSRRLVGDSQLRWLGPEKGAVHMAAGAVVNAVWDLAARRAGKPVWQLLSELSPEQLVDLVDFRYLRDALTEDEALAILRAAEGGRAERTAQLLERGHPAYTTTPGWLGYDDDTAGPAVPGGRRRRLRDDQAQGRGRSGRGRPPATARPRGRRAGPAHWHRRQPGLGSRRGHRQDSRSGGVRPVLDRGADLPRRCSRPRGDPPRGLPDPGGHRRAHRQPGDVQAAAPGPGRRRRPARRVPGGGDQREPGHPAAGREVRGAGLPARRRGRAV